MTQHLILINLLGLHIFLIVKNALSYKTISRIFLKQKSIKIKVYGADWCRDCINVKNYLSSKDIDFEYIVFSENHDAIAFLEEVNNGKRVIPTIIIEGKIYVNPGINKLIKIIEE